MNLTLQTLGRLWLSLTNRPRTARRLRPPTRRGAAALVVGMLVFVALQVALSAVSLVTRFVADPVYADKERRLRWLERDAPPGTPRVILIGTSRTGFAYAAGRTQQAATEAGTPAITFNFGLPGAGPVAHQLYLRRLLAEGHKPDLLILEVLPPLLADLPDGPLEGRIITGDVLTGEEVARVASYGFPTKRVNRQWTRAMLNPISTHRFKLLGRVFPSAVSWQFRYDWGRTFDPNGWNPSDIDEVPDEKRAQDVEATLNEYRGVLRHELPAGPAADALRDTLVLCRAEGIPVALIILPETTAFSGLYSPAVEAKVMRFLSGLTAEFGCTFTDARRWLPDKAFRDGHHLLRPGAVAFTDRLTAEVVLPFLRARTAGRASP